ncbi:MAG: hypothetical protein ACLQVY_11960 [Limisphaerales bacterium]
MPLYKDMTPAQQNGTDVYFRTGINLLLKTSMAVNTARFNPATSDADAASLDAKYADLQGQLSLFERQQTAVYASTQSVGVPAQASIDNIKSLSDQVDQLNKDQAVAGAYLAAADQVLGAAQKLATG